jgi:hypothetical protein
MIVGITVNHDDASKTGSSGCDEGREEREETKFYAQVRQHNAKRATQVENSGA